MSVFLPEGSIVVQLRLGVYHVEAGEEIVCGLPQPFGAGVQQTLLQLLRIWTFPCLRSKLA